MTRRLRPPLLPLLVASLLVGAGCGSDQPSRPVTGSVRGTITNIEDGTPFPGAIVFLVDTGTIRPVTSPARTDAAGRFAFVRVAPGDYAAFIYTCDRLVFDRSAPVIHVHAGEVAEQRTRLLQSALWDCRGYRIVGAVKEAGTRKPLPGAYVETWGWAGQDFTFESGTTVPEWAITDSIGRFSITSTVATDEHGNEVALFPISVSRYGYEPTTLVGNVTVGYGLPFLPLPAGGDSALSVEVLLDPLDSRGIGPHGAGAIHGSVTYLGRPIAGLRVAASLWDSANPDTFVSSPLGVAVPIPDNIAVTDTAGRFTIDRLAPGDYSVIPGFLEGDGYVFPGPAGQPHAIAESETTEVGAIAMYKATAQIAPAGGSTITTQTPEFRWEGISDCPVVVYRLWYTVGHFFDDYVETTEPRWQTPDSLHFNRGDNVRWYVETYCVGDGDHRDEAATFEEVATFTVSP